MEQFVMVLLLDTVGRLILELRTNVVSAVGLRSIAVMIDD